MRGTPLPARAKPEVLYEVCSQLDSTQVERIELYNVLDIDRRQISAATDYGDKLGFLELEDRGGKTPHVALSDHGFALSHAESMNESAVENSFREAIRGYEPYRTAILSIYKKGKIEKINGKNAIESEVLQDSINRYIEKEKEEASTRAVNLLIKTMQAAGLGDRKVGRHSYPTRIVINSGFEGFAKEISQDFELPEKTKNIGGKQNESTDTGTSGDSRSGGDKPSGDRHAGKHLRQIVTELNCGDMTLHIDIDVSNKEKDEISNIIKTIQSLE